MIDMQQSSTEVGIITFPDFAFGDLPRQEPIKETIYLQGNDSTTGIYLTGNLDNPNQ